MLPMLSLFKREYGTAGRELFINTHPPRSFYTVSLATLLTSYIDKKDITQAMPV